MFLTVRNRVRAPPSGKPCVRPEMKPLIIPRLLEGGEWHTCARRVCVFVLFQARRTVDDGLCNAAAHVQSFPAHSVNVFSSVRLQHSQQPHPSTVLVQRWKAEVLLECFQGRRPGDTMKTMKTVATGSSLRNQPSVCHIQTS